MVIIIINEFKINLSKIVSSAYNKINNYISFTNDYTFENRSKNNDSLCIILAGYKEFLWDIIFDRIVNFSEENIDICIVSSGLYNEKLSNLAQMNGWSYLSTKKNSVIIAQNTAIKLFPMANYIYKLDEDIFITDNFFNTLKDTYDRVQEYGEYNVGFVAPILPINGYSHVVLLKKLNLVEYYSTHFEKVKYCAGSDRMIESNPEVAKFMWGHNNKIPHIDEINDLLQHSPFSYSAVPIRFSIGAILYSRELWEEMKYFRVRRGTGLGLDERQICSYCLIHSKAMIVSENSCVGHLSFQPQNEEMKKYYLTHPEHFKIKKI